MLLKVFIGIYFYNMSTLSALRSYFIARYTYNFLIICPVHVALHIITKTFLPNFFLTLGLLMVLELIIGSCYVKYLYRKQPVEIIEDIPGLKIVAQNLSPYDVAGPSKRLRRGKKQRNASPMMEYICKMNTNVAAQYLKN